MDLQWFCQRSFADIDPRANQLDGLKENKSWFQILELSPVRAFEGAAEPPRDKAGSQAGD